MLYRKTRAVALALAVAALWFLFSPWSFSDGGLPASSFTFPSGGPSDATSRPAKFRYVDPLIGTLKGGHVFAGATLPFGMAKAVADVTGEKQGGFASDGSTIQGFSHMHDLGVGWMPSLGNFPIMPFTGCPNNNVSDCPFYKLNRAVPSVEGSVKANPGYFAISLDSGVQAEMTVSHHTALYRFDFDSTNQLYPVVLASLEDLQNTYPIGFVSVDSTSGRIEGNATFMPSFGTGKYKAYFCADFSGAKIRATGRVSTTGEIHYSGFLHEKAEDAGEYAGGWVQFEPSKEILVRVGVSFISNQQACRNAESEVSDFNFEKTLADAESAWEDKFSSVKIDGTGASEEMQTVFWTGIYRSFISPQNYTNENPLWESTEPYFDSWYCIWDTFRTTHPLLTLVDPKAQTEMVRSLLDIFVHEGKMPDCRMSLCQGYTQGGSNADVVVADALLKNLTEGIDWKTAWSAVLSDAEVSPKNFLVAGRGGLGYWREGGYIPSNSGNSGRSVSRSVEYAYNDFCISQMAEILVNDAVAELYLHRSENWVKLFSPDVPSYIPSGPLDRIDTGFSGFLQPRKVDGTFAYQDPVFCSPLLEFNACYFDTGHATYEGSLWLYTFLAAPGDMAAVISQLGGADEFVKRLDYFHESGILDIGDEQSFLTVYMYHYAGRPALSAKRVHSYIPSAFNASVNGLPGNDDSGAMGAFASLSMVGLFPNAGQDVYLIIPPFFKEISITNRLSGKTATIKAVNFDSEYQNIYIQSAKLNGENWTKNWLSHSFFVDGGTLELVLGPTESDWGTKIEDLPPSSSTRQKKAVVK